MLALLAVGPGVAHASLIPSQTTIRCYGIGTGGMRSCTVGVYADVPPGAPVPTGTISWVSSGPGSETVTTSCGINAYHPTWGPPFPNVIWCENGYLSPGMLAPRTEDVVATYSGDALYAPSVGTTAYYVRDPNGTIPEATDPAQPSWRPEPAGGKDRATEAPAVAPPVRAVVDGIAAGRAGLSFVSTAPGASVIRIERRVRSARAGHRATTSWRTVRRIRRTLSGGSNRIAVRLRPGVHRVTIGGATVQRVRRTVTVAR
ncbi:hypothetical protein [Patulibacter sp.]|uniref:hypothetical protein n=1 Tax=Patulibacter sp. TaxID=1912859 RepID=UPI002728A66B|nr:hypothetical protein [Patulibacter sp.]MDO9410449.1 hypothetical protein [Patulibacter sp.]